MNDLVAVLLLNYNQNEYTLKCVDSILKSEDKLFKIILIDNGSTKENAKALEEQLPDDERLVFHRIEDNLIEGKKGFTGIHKAWWTLIWFWIPAHTVTFSLPVHYQIGLAAVWGLVLGIILGTTTNK